MKQKLSKNLRIISDLISFCHNEGAVQFSVRLHPGRELSSFEIKAEIPELSPDALEELNAALKLPRMHEIEQDYWELGGNTGVGDSSELTLIGMMLDESSAVYRDGELTITAQRSEG